MIESNRPDAHTLVSRAAADNVQFCVESALSAGIDGDLIETGVFRGGLGILMRGVLRAWGETGRKVYCADSWEGLPAPGGLLDDQVVFLKGWFAEKSLYPKLQTGGWLIVDDYGAPVGARRAIDEYRRDHAISEPILKADHQVVYWQKNS
jgi:O-methyltransferase